MLQEKGGTVLVGGGGFPKEAVKWAYDHSSGGEFIVIACDYINSSTWSRRLAPYSFDVIVLVCREDADLEENIRKINRAAVIILDGGDQYDYVRFLKSTRLSEAINRAIANKVPICGTSAGEAVLGGAFFSAKHGTVFSDSVLLNPEHLSVDIDWNFFQIPHLEDVIFDSHYTERERHGRLLGFMSKSKTRGIGIDESTALCVDRRGRAVVFGEGHVYFVNSVGLNCFAVYIMNKSGWFSIRDWSGRGGQQFDWKVCDGILDSGDKHNK